ncbi:diacylglycerol acyltransferase-domain-containing protein [Poronia punctata]|nr:diacylglycerol acyltransferase-domain-containing protein [Poronia punctata]
MADPSVPGIAQSKTDRIAPRYFYLSPKKSSQSSTLSRETYSALEAESAPAREDFRPNPTSTSQESHDSPAAETLVGKVVPPESKRLHTEAEPVSCSPERGPRNVPIPPTLDTPHIASRLSHTPRGPSREPSAPRPFWRRTSPHEVPTNSVMADQIDNKMGPANITLKRQNSRSPDLPQREESYVNVDGMSTQLSNGQTPADDGSLRKTNGIAEADSGRAPEDETQDGISYASVVKNGLQNGYDDRDHDADDSYPELDDMEEVHRPPKNAPVKAGIRWVPWNVPLKRRGQTLVVLMHSLSIVGTVSIFFWFCAIPFLWPLLLFYLLRVLNSKAGTDGLHKHRSERFRRSYIWHFFADYFPARLHKTHDLPPTRKYIFGYHPHGIISHGAWAAFATDALGFSEKFPGITNSLLTLDSNFRIPFYREYVLGMGIQSVSKEGIVNNLTRGGSNGEGMGRAVTVVVGGARESLEAQPGMMRLILQERKGFIKLAIRCGADLVPVLAFGENNLYDQLQPHEHPYMHRIQMFLLKVWKFTLPFLHGRGIFNYDVGLMPYRTPLNVVVGAPIKVRQSSSVNPEEVNRLHGLYVAELQKLWDRYKDEFAPDRKEEMRILP